MNCLIKKATLVLFFHLFALTTLKAQSVTPPLRQAGKDFWFSHYFQSPLSSIKEAHVFIISGNTNANITFHFFASGNNQSYYLQAGQLLRIELDSVEVAALSDAPFNTPHNKCIHITSDENISVQYAHLFNYSDEGTIIYPADEQAYGNEYILNGPRNIGFATPLSPGSLNYTLISSCDSLVLEITPTQRVIGHPSGIPFTLVLNRGQAYCLSGDSTTLDLSGTKIRIKKSNCCNPLSVFMDYLWDFIYWPLPPPGISLTCCADRLLEQLLPVSHWNSFYPLVRFKNNPYSMIKITSMTNNNKIYFDGIYRFILNANQGYDTIINNASIVSSDAPICIIESMITQEYTYHNPYDPLMPIDSFSDPSSIVVLPLSQGVKETYFRSFETVPNPNPQPIPFYNADYQFNALTLISETANVPAVKLNGSSVASQFIPFPGNANYQYAYILLDTGLYHLQSDERIIAYYYGAYQRGSAAYNLGDISQEQDSFSLCISDTPFHLTAPAADSFLWSDGSRAQTLPVSQTGVYTVQLFYAGAACPLTRSYTVTVNPYTQTHTTDSFVKCPDELLTLTAGAADSYLWSDDLSTSPSRMVAQYGIYTVTETHAGTCSQTVHDFVVIPFEDALPFFLGNDTALCAGDQITLYSPYAATLWSDGHRGLTYVLTQPGIYWAQYTDTCGNILSDTITVRDTLCMKNFCNMVFPNAFTPNNDGRNDLFKAISYGEFYDYTLEVYDRWGERVYKTHSPTSGWDGTFKGIIAPGDVYFYMCTYKCPLKGDVTLIR